VDTIELLSGRWWNWIVAASWQLAIVTCVVGALVALLRRASPRLRHALWLIVLVKVFLPPGLTAPWSIGRFVAPRVAAAGISLSPNGAIQKADSTETEDGSIAVDDDAAGIVAAQNDSRLARATKDAVGLSTRACLMLAWLTGLFVFAVVVLARYVEVLRVVREATVIDEGPIRVLAERIGLALHLQRLPELLATLRVSSPFLFGALRPRIVLPAALMADLNETELRAVLTHELIHWQRRDVWIGWLQVVGQGMFWFHPFLWWVNRELRHERECACDEAVLRLGEVRPQQYGDSIVRVLMAARARSMATGSLVGVFERGTKLQNRLEEIVNHESAARRFGWWSRLAVAALALLVLPIAPGASQPGKASDLPEKTPYPQIVSTTPKIGATDVAADLQWITVTFDRDMADGMSWTGGPPFFPQTDEKRQAKWKDQRTCVLPVKLAAGTYYRLGINSTSYRNFRAQGGPPAPPSALYFATKGANADVAARVEVPKIVSLSPANDAQDVDPSTTQLQVTFDRPMGEGMSWTGRGPKVPKMDNTIPPRWSSDGRVCAISVKLEPGHDYEIGLNDPHNVNFQSSFGVPLKAIVYRFRTAGK
jgi:beta-lactamase regulating signal transducer with metallopeptidase domain